MSESLLHAFKGADLYFAESKHISVKAAEEDQTEEEESLLNSFDVDDREAAGTLQFSTTNTAGGEDNVKKKKPKHSNNQLASSLQAASEGVVIGTTLSDYQRYWNQFKEFCVTIDKAQVASEIDNLFLNLLAEFPMWIALWIMDK
ncbi:hypothetical protein EDB19DRAFT_1905565 [Suillus lakei]|nr:hypothetical protein EDB19DRAFT_1905565 [Suillus lakei]